MTKVDLQVVEVDGKFWAYVRSGGLLMASKGFDSGPEAYAWGREEVARVKYYYDNFIYS